MANIVLHTEMNITIDLNKLAKGDSVTATQFDVLYELDRMDAENGVPVAERGLQCAGVCMDRNVVAWM